MREAGYVVRDGATTNVQKFWLQYLREINHAKRMPVNEK